MASESGKFKKGDWVRATENWLSVKTGDLCTVGRIEDDDGYWVRRHGEGPDNFYMTNSELEPWTPAVGDRVRMVNLVAGHKAECGATVVLDDKTGSANLLLKFDEPQRWSHTENNWWVNASDIEPHIATPTATTTYKRGDLVRVTGNAAWNGVGKVYEVDHRWVYVTMQDGGKKGQDGGFPFGEVEPVVDEPAATPTKFKAGDRVRYVGENDSVFYTNGKDYDVLTEGSEYWYTLTDNRDDGPHSWSIDALREQFTHTPATPPTTTPLQIESGRYYKTRDGRKVGPMLDDWGLEKDYKYHVSREGNGELGGSLWRVDGKHYGSMQNERDLIALWQDEPAAKPANDNASSGSMVQTYRNITKRDGNESAIKGKAFTLREACANDYGKDRLATIPAGTSIIADFAGDFGMYGLAEVNGVLHKVKVDLHDLHKIDFGDLDARDFKDRDIYPQQAA